ncbi:helix-turn-helix domain-containing protein [Christensenella sp. MSJ-20]|uniref:helix-turn-helix domain-containing protein n=1 Tax=Christensenella sp. MSJ-20 TaxID=2841518 RepID=UPI001C740D2F|nr:helix-turn-helix domain-containing protein [Christensenella sp. MSJ-20]
MFWQRLTALCDENKIKPNVVTKELGLSSATATHWKNGSIPNGVILDKLADYFNVSTDYLLGRTDNPLLEPPTLVLTPDEQAAVEAFLAGYRAKKDS